MANKNEIETSPKKTTKSLKQRQLMMLSGIMSMFFLVIILLIIPSNLDLFGNEASANADELNRVYHLEENGYMLDNGDFVRVSLSFVTADNNGIPKLSRGRPFIKNTVTKILSGTDRDAFKGSDGLNWFESEIRNELNDSFSDIDVERVYITSIVIS
ncbi:flagellar basal body-associated FliL family protein [Salipaludibacillus daqingensis]|uniref:flagellar basal body-associated FliL family protein n=1 Tax=Salipaludibacillus daqingensis TaxID=3041001 RepID=UPI00247366FB|nr:flagellar basal body-associated FliL family protein [Salipaludibacillus daqingensis]